MPWLVADRVVAPVEFRWHYSEALLYLPDTYYGAGHHIFAPHSSPLPRPLPQHRRAVGGQGGGGENGKEDVVGGGGGGRKDGKGGSGVKEGGEGGGGGGGAVKAGLSTLLSHDGSAGVPDVVPKEGLVFGAFSNLGKVNAEVSQAAPFPPPRARPL